MAVMTASAGILDRARTRYFDLYMVVVTLLLVAFGLIAVYSADGGGSLLSGNLAVRQFVFFVLGCGMAALVALLDYRVLQRLSPIIYGISLLLLGGVLVAGTVIGGARRWFDFRFILFQPSEVAKLAVAIALAAFISNRDTAMARWYNFVLSLVIVVIPALLIYRQPDLGTALVLFAIWAGMMSISKTRPIYFVLLAAVGIPTGYVLWEKLPEYQRNRLDAFLDPSSPKNIRGEGYNIIQAQNSIGSGGATGNGINGSFQSGYDFLKVRTTDFIFAHAAAMFGFLGCLALLTLFFMLIWRYLKVVTMAGDSFGRFLAIGIAAQVFFQIVVNIGMNARMLPVTGVPLPFISYGGTQLWVLLIGQGMLQSILVRHQKFVIG